MAASSSSSSRRMQVYWEPQDASLCAVHAVNNLLQVTHPTSFEAPLLCVFLITGQVCPFFTLLLVVCVVGTCRAPTSTSDILQILLGSLLVQFISHHCISPLQLKELECVDIGSC